ncbi:hypothetical protein MARPO_0030s0094 [Marchantia polymorpha]|uniref:Uncharacterized protein n=1 Tax=Marchantia polymorpha TaxID=3197 RepID=A0A2R6X8D0_MARPO|nr:hypothetical protein MARPO_0030s0094 [Marchantia polymorpha]|eukprot:PTQ42362.1 hypothetical protein MARPO_0030s0094 [Marchantia polymorpha]
MSQFEIPSSVIGKYLHNRNKWTTRSPRNPPDFAFPLRTWEDFILRTQTSGTRKLNSQGSVCLSCQSTPEPFPIFQHITVNVAIGPTVPRFLAHPSRKTKSNPNSARSHPSAALEHKVLVPKRLHLLRHPSSSSSPGLCDSTRPPLLHFVGTREVIVGTHLPPWRVRPRRRGECRRGDRRGSRRRRPLVVGLLLLRGRRKGSAVVVAFIEQEVQTVQHRQRQQQQQQVGLSEPPQRRQIERGRGGGGWGEETREGGGGREGGREAMRSGRAALLRMACEGKQGGNRGGVAAVVVAAAGGAGSLRAAGAHVRRV